MKIPTTPVLFASLSLASSSLAAPTREKPDCDSPILGENCPLLGQGQDAWGSALNLKGRGVGGQGRPWGTFPVQKRQAPSTGIQPSSPIPPPSPAPSFASSSTPLLGAAAPLIGAGASGSTAQIDQASAAAAGLLTPVTGTLKGVVGDTTGALKGLLGNTPLGPVVGTVGDIGNGLLDKVGEIGNGGLGLGPILKPVKDIAGGLPIVGPIAGGLVDTVGGLNVAPQSLNGLPAVGRNAAGLTGNAGSVNLAQQPMDDLPVTGPLAGTVLNKLGVIDFDQMPGATLTPNVSPQLDAFPSAQMVEENIVGRLEDGRLVTNTGRIIGLASTTGSPFANLPTHPTMGLGGGTATGQLPGQVYPADLGKVIASLPPGLGQILQPIGGAEKYLQIGNRLIPLGAVDASQLSQLGLDRLPVTPVGAGFGYPGINYLQEGAAPEPMSPEADEDGKDSKEVKANPVTTWMNGGNATVTDVAACNNGSMSDTNSTMPGTADNSTMTDTGDATMPLSTKSHIPTTQLEIQPLELAPPGMTSESATNQTIAGKPNSLIKGDVDPWYEVEIDGGDTFKRIAAEISGEEKNYYSGGERDPATESGYDSDNDGSSTKVPTHKGSGLVASGIEIGGGKPVFDGDKGRVGWQDISGTPPPASHEWHSSSARITASASPTMSSVHGHPTQGAHDDVGTYAWSEEWGDWVSAGMGDTDLHVGWDGDASAFASATISSPLPSSTHMGAHANAGLA